MSYIIAAFSPSRLRGHLRKSFLRKRFLLLKRIIFSDYVTVRFVRVYQVLTFLLILFIEQTCVQRTTPVLIKRKPLKPSGFLLSHNVCYTFVKPDWQTKNMRAMY